ncbi:tRNA lysidine(34) synthetase TilS [Marinobacter bryozoorum]|jgi:tRNA(Ile)-lysidine synthase|uniref:tRNA lysidine(34) synthetase TilS n=1 Tax=Marinobacter bryozoorum TaxID=256324 RepID=UPI002002DDCD|nr:tRNA lysidine(34) synthetase TilS [Marinobacter bryozoorum]MCK7543287.1 tRNA lysidine(34) synthetase TilS [Marinobacter bryozoorum]
MTPGGNPRPDAFFPELLAPLQALTVTGQVRVALSGGLDSMVLLHLARQVFGQPAGQLSAVHVNHQLQPAAQDFESACISACEALSVPLEVVPVSVSTAESSVETAARDARYQVFARLMEPGDVLLMAHHGDDQSETLLFRFVRGTGVRGLGGIPAARPLGKGRVVRPLLGVSRECLHRQAVAAGIQWQEDPTNAVSDVDRNFLRHEIIPRLAERWPGLRQRLAATARACSESRELADLLARTHFEQLADGPHRIFLGGVRQLPLSARRNLLQWWLGDDLGRTLSDPELEDLVNSAPDARPEILGHRFALCRFRGHIYRVARNPAPQAADQLLVPGQSVRDGEFTICLQGRAEIDEAARFRLTHRRGGERLRERAGGPSRPLKKWLQDQGLPPWERERLPLIFRGEALVAVGDLWQSPELECATAGGWQLDIRRGRGSTCGSK